VCGGTAKPMCARSFARCDANRGSFRISCGSLSIPTSQGVLYLPVAKDWASVCVARTLTPASPSWLSGPALFVPIAVAIRLLTLTISPLTAVSMGW
jgi:hypothetical protein